MGSMSIGDWIGAALAGGVVIWALVMFIGVAMEARYDAKMERQRRAARKAVERRVSKSNAEVIRLKESELDNELRG